MAFCQKSLSLPVKAIRAVCGRGAAHADIKACENHSVIHRNNSGEQMTIPQ